MPDPAVRVLLAGTAVVEARPHLDNSLTHQGKLVITLTAE